MGFRRRRWRDVAPEKDKVRVNRAIRVPEVRVVNEDGQQLGVMPTDAARDIASRIGLDLVEISPNGTPPVCKIMDYGRYKYELKKKAATAKRSQHQSQLKEIKLRPADRRARSRLQAARGGALPDRRRQGEGDGHVPRPRDHAPAGRTRPARSRGEAARGDREGGVVAPHGRAHALADRRARPRGDQEDRWRGARREQEKAARASRGGGPARAGRRANEPEMPDDSDDDCTDDARRRSRTTTRARANEENERCLR